MENRIKEVIQEKGYLLKHIASKIGVSKTDMSNYIANRRKPSSSRLTKLSRVLNCKVTDLYPQAKRVVKWII
mgnify:CR=1 FL=1